MSLHEVQTTPLINLSRRCLLKKQHLTGFSNPSTSKRILEFTFQPIFLSSLPLQLTCLIISPTTIPTELFTLPSTPSPFTPFNGTWFPTSLNATHIDLKRWHRPPTLLFTIFSDRRRGQVRSSHSVLHLRAYLGIAWRFLLIWTAVPIHFRNHPQHGH